MNIAADVELISMWIERGAGVKVKPNDLPREISQTNTIEQIGKASKELGAYADDYGQQVRLEAHGQCAPLPIIASIMQVADHRIVTDCRNSNPQDLHGAGLAPNCRLVKKRLGATTHMRQLDGNQYPCLRLFELLKRARFARWILIEASDHPPDRIAALVEQREAFEKLSGAQSDRRSMAKARLHSRPNETFPSFSAGCIEKKPGGLNLSSSWPDVMEKFMNFDSPAYAFRSITVRSLPHRHHTDIKP